MITIDRNELLRCLQIVSKAANNKSTLPILGCVKLNASGTKLDFETSNMEMTIKTSITCFSEPEILCIDVKQFTDIVKKLPVGDVNITCDANLKITLSAGKKIKFSLQGQDPEFFPITKIEAGDELTLKASDLKDAVAGVSFCTSVLESNKTMQGINIKVDGDKVKLTALDGHRIAIKVKSIPTATSIYDIIVPGADLSDVMKILPDSDVKITISDKNIMLVADETIVTMRLINGDYFKVDQMIATEFVTSVTINKQDLFNAVDRTSLLLNEAEKRPIIMNFTDNGIHLTAKAGKGNAEEDIDISKKEGNDIKIGFNPRFIMDMLRVIPEDEITLGLINSKAPVVVNAKDTSYTYLVLPVNFVEVA